MALRSIFELPLITCYNIHIHIRLACTMLDATKLTVYNIAALTYSLQLNALTAQWRQQTATAP